MYNIYNNDFIVIYYNKKDHKKYLMNIDILIILITWINDHYCYISVVTLLIFIFIHID